MIGALSRLICFPARTLSQHLEGSSSKSKRQFLTVELLRKLLMSSPPSPPSPSSMTAVEASFQQLCNSMNVKVEKGHVEVTLTSHLVIQEVAAKKPRLQNTTHLDTDPGTTTTDKEANDRIPESVIQYERHLRKVKANQQSVAELSMEKHLKIIYEDSHLIVVDKPSGALCVPGLNNKPNILQLVCQHLTEKGESGFTETKSEMIVHRLDMDTSGLVVFSKTTEALRVLQAAFRDRNVLTKEYHALVCGHLPSDWVSGDIHLPLQRDHRCPPFMRVATERSEAEAQAALKDLQTHGFRKLVKKKPKPSHTEFKVLQREYLELGSQNVDSKSDDNNAKIPVTRLALTPHTGRTHQLRVHCAAIGYPIVGDPAYGLFGEAQFRGGLDPNEYLGAPINIQKDLNQHRPPHDDKHKMCLHATKLGLEHPISKQNMLWVAETPF